jgi:hypothetical protein
VRPSFGRTRGQFLPYLIAVESMVRIPRGRPRRPVFAQRDAQGFVFPPLRAHFELLQFAVRVREKSLRILRQPLPMWAVGTTVANPIELNLFPPNGPQISNFGMRPITYDQWAGWSRYREQELARQRQRTKMLITRKQIRKPKVTPRK